MLQRLDISNYALIENVQLNLNPGFTVITGETGAGKSILLKALNLLMGERADTSVLKQSEKKCVLEAVFDLSELDLADFFAENELDFEKECIVRREFNTSGKSRSFINDTPVQLTQLKRLGEQLITIHTQHQTLEILQHDFQMDVLNHFAGIANDAKSYKKEYTAYRSMVNKHIELQAKELENRKEKDYLTFLLNELEEAQPEKIDLDALKQQADKIENAESIKNSIAFAKSVFENDSFSPSIGVKTLIETFDDIKSYDPLFADIAARLWSVKIELDDMASELDGRDDFDEFTEEEAQQIKEKLEQINALCFKHNLSEPSELVTLKNNISADLNTMTSVEDELLAIEKELKQRKSDLEKKAEKLDQQRQKALSKLEKDVAERLTGLAMPNARLKIALEKRNELSVHGYNHVDFLFSTNLGGQFSPIKKIASGGELSRLMLVILSILSEKKKLPTLIFDEIDTGVSGEVAAKMALEFENIAQNIQVISITHLPQVAGRGKYHLHVSKSDEKNKTETKVVSVDGNERLHILAGMMSADKITEAALQNAATLLNNK